MADIFDYLTWRGDLPLEEQKFNEVDGMILSRLSYLPFEYSKNLCEKGYSLIGEVCNELLSFTGIEVKVLFKQDIQLLKQVSQSVRFSKLKMFGYINQLDPKTQTQFSAISVKLRMRQYFVAFRGTDDTLIGWKEDLNMCFACPVPAQVLAVKYLSEISGEYKGMLITGGHSKGGNLAVYAAAFCKPSIQKRIEAIYNYDGPGFDEKVLISDNYKKISDKIKTYIPQCSVVGKIMGHGGNCSIVHSAQSIGILQHDTYSWEIQRDKFVYFENITNSSLIFDLTLKGCLSEMNYTQREKFVDAIYMILTETNAHTLKDLSGNWIISAKNILKSIKNLDDDTRKAVIQTLHLLVKNARKGIFQAMKKNNNKI